MVNLLAEETSLFLLPNHKLLAKAVAVVVALAAVVAVKDAATINFIVRAKLFGRSSLESALFLCPSCLGFSRTRAILHLSRGLLSIFLSELLKISIGSL